MEDRVTLVNNLRTVPTRRLVEHMFIKQNLKYVIDKFQFNMKKLLSEYVTFLVAINTFSNNFKYPHAGKSQNIFGNMNLKSFRGNVFPLRFSYFF